MRYGLIAFLVLTACLLGQQAPSQETAPPTSLPMTGMEDPRFRAFDEAMQKYMQERSIAAGTLAVRWHNKLIYERAYGYADREKTQPLTPDAMFRLASVTKPMTAAAIRCLVADGKLSLNEKVFEILKFDPPATDPDPRLAEITVDHLIYHHGGWDRSTSFDPLFSPFRIAEAMNLDHTPTPREIAQYMLTQPLQFNPGERRAYSNFGYLLLGLIIEERSGMSFEAYMQNRVMAPLGIRDCYLARTREDQQREGEIWYAYQGYSRSVLDLSSREPAPWAYGGFSLEAQFANGGLVMRARDVARFMETYDAFGNPLQKGAHWLHFGAMPGTYTMALWRSDGMKIVALFNQRNGGRNLREDAIRDMLDAAANQVLEQLNAD